MPIVRPGRSLLFVCLALALSPGLLAQSAADEALVAKAKAIHARVIALDTHDDINPSNFTAAKNYTQPLDTQVNLPKMIAGGLDAAFFIVYVGQGELAPKGYDEAYKAAIEKFEAIHRLTEQIAPNQIELALTAADVRRIAASGKKVALIGVENGYPIGEDLSRVKEFHDRGARYLSLAHNGHSQLADSNTGERDGKWLHNGLSPLGQQVIAEANKWGLMIDISHPAKTSNLQAIALSKAPVIASHSGVRALCDHSRNLDDEQLLALKKNGGVAQIVAFSTYVKTPKPDSPERAAAVAALRKELGLPEAPAGGGGGFGGGGRGALANMSEDQREQFQKKMAALNKQYPPDRATVQDFVNHVDYAVKKIGIDHVGIASDFDGGGGVNGWNDASETFNVTLELVKRGYTEPQIAKLWSGNLLRVMDDVQKVAKDLQDAPASAALVVSLTRSACFGTCPDYDVTLYNDGKVVYNGRRYVKEVGSRTKTVDVVTIDRVKRALQDARVATLDPKCCDCYEVTDHPTATIAFEVDGRRQTIKHYHGCSKAPPALKTLENTIDELLGTVEFIGTAEERGRMRPAR